jgi:hypothetical protein
MEQTSGKSYSFFPQQVISHDLEKNIDHLGHVWRQEVLTLPKAHI